MTTLHNKLSLTKKIEGGYIHVRKNTSPSKKKSKLGYSQYLQQSKESNISEKSDKSSSKKISIHSRSIKRKHSKKNKKNKKNPLLDVNPKKPITNKPITKKPITKKPIPTISEPVIVKPVIVKPVIVKPDKHGVTSKYNKDIISHVTSTTNKVSRKNTSNKLSFKNRKISHKKKRSGKRFSVTKNRISNKEIEHIQSKIKSIRKKSTEEIKQELDKQGIKLTGKSPNILKDIYMYSQLCGINITRE